MAQHEKQRKKRQPEFIGGLNQKPRLEEFTLGSESTYDKIINMLM